MRTPGSGSPLGATSEMFCDEPAKETRRGRALAERLTGAVQLPGAALVPNCTTAVDGMLVMVMPSLPILMALGMWGVCAAAKEAAEMERRASVRRIIHTSGSGLWRVNGDSC